jgi:flagellar hook-associated protein 1 FlgK
MPNLTSSLGVGLSGIQASQEAMSVIGHNIANVNTPGYTQQAAVLTTNPSQNFSNLQFGSGVNVKAVQSLRNQFLNLQLTQSIAGQSGSETRYKGIQAVAPAFADDGTTGLNTQMDGFFRSLKTLAGNPESTSLAENVVGSAQTMLTEFQSTYQTVTGQMHVANQEVAALVPQINTLTTQIASLNYQISNQVDPSHDNDAIDQRQALTDQLAKLVGIQTSTDSANNLQITLDSGAATLVSGGSAYQMTTSGNNLQVAVTSGNVSTDVTGLITGGELGANLDLRDRMLPGYLTQLDQVAGSLANQVNTVSMSGYGTDASGKPVKGVPMFTGTGIDNSNPPDANFGHVNLKDNSQPASASNPPNYHGIVNSLTVNPDMVAAPSLVATSCDGNSGDNSTILKMAGLGVAAGTVDTKGDGVGDSGPFSSVVTAMVNAVGTQAQQYNATATNQQNLTSALQTQKTSESGVDLDQEAAQLLSFQQAYQASAQFISTISQLTNQLMTTMTSAMG